VAIKSLDLKLIDRKKIFAEIQILKLLNHQNHIKLLETFNTEKHICLVMELCPGGDLLSYIRKRRILTETWSKYLFR
jgi:serine/threonine protein kinase